MLELKIKKGLSEKKFNRSKKKVVLHSPICGNMLRIIDRRGLVSVLVMLLSGCG